jgi:hypothetical protein
MYSAIDCVRVEIHTAHTGCCTAVYWMDECLAALLPSGMTPRRSRYAPTDESRIPHWLVTYDVCRTILSSKQLAIGTDLEAAMRQAIEKSRSDGWTVENDGAYGFFFCNRNGERREVRLQPTDPSQPVPLNNTSPFGACGSSRGNITSHFQRREFYMHRILAILVASAFVMAAASAADVAQSSTPQAPEAPVAIPQPTWLHSNHADQSQVCCKICTVGKACGDTCISRDKDCHVGRGCACDG